ncbi:MAG TPA: glutathione S-transferase family protein [Solirubrobacteraceae bacterium]|nr:glutathione S-transferase family protein [Solirubrobacteraceae bacterium]
MSASDPQQSDATLYVIHGSHACRAAMLMLAHKQVPYRTVTLPTGAHPTLLRLLGFAGHRKPIRSVNGQTSRSLAALDRMGTVPALKLGAERVQTNRAIARRLEELVPEPPLFPSDPERRREVEAAEEWADETFQMAARRTVLAGALHGLDGIYNRANDGRLGALLARGELLRRINNQAAARVVFGAGSAQAEQALLEELPAMLDRIDGWIAQGVLGGERLNAADFLIAPSLALLAYRLDLREGIEARPLGALVERVLPEPVVATR